MPADDLISLGGKSSFSAIRGRGGVINRSTIRDDGAADGGIMGGDRAGDLARNLPAEELATDSRFVQRLFRKVQRALATRGPYGVVEISESFKRLDRALTREAFEARQRSQVSRRYASVGGDGGISDSPSRAKLTSSLHAYIDKNEMIPKSNPLAIADFTLFSRYLHDGLSMQGVTLREIEVLFLLLDDGGDGRVDMADALLAIRKLFHCTAQQFHEVLKKVRSKRPQLIWRDDERVRNPFRKRSGGTPSRPPSRASVFDYLMSGMGLGGGFGLTESEACLFLDYCSIQEKDAGGGGGARAGSSDSAAGYFNATGGLPPPRTALYLEDPSSTSYSLLGSPPPHHNHFHQEHRDMMIGEPLIGELDVSYVETVLFSDTLPDEVAFPLVMAKFVESATDPLKGDMTGTSGVLRALRQCPLVPNPNTIRSATKKRANDVAAAGGRRQRGDARDGPPSGPLIVVGGLPSRRVSGGSPSAQPQQRGASRHVDCNNSPEVDDRRRDAHPRGGGGVPTPQKRNHDLSSSSSSESDDGEGPTSSRAGRSKGGLMAQCLDVAAFRKFLHIFQGGLPVAECDLLFDYLCDLSTSPPLLSVEALVRHFQDRLDVWAAVDMRLTLMSLRTSVNLLRLHSCLAPQFGLYVEIPLENVIAALRRCGVAPSDVADIEIEHVYRETRTAAALVLLIRGPVPQGREHTIRKLFDRLLDDNASGGGGGGEGRVSGELMLRAFDPSQPPNAKAAVALQSEMYEFIQSLAVAAALEERETAAVHASSISNRQHYLCQSNGGGLGLGLGGYGQRGRSLGGSSSYSSVASGGGGGAPDCSSVHLTYSEFTYFWGCVSLLFDTDALFSLFVWKAYRLHEGGGGDHANRPPERRGWATVVPHRREPVPLARLVSMGTGPSITSGGGGGGVRSSSVSAGSVGYSSTSFFLGGGGGGGGSNSVRGASGGGGGGLYYSGSAIPYNRNISSATSFSRGLSSFGGAEFSRHASLAGGFGDGGGVRRR